MSSTRHLVVYFNQIYIFKTIKDCLPQHRLAGFVAEKFKELSQRLFTVIFTGRNEVLAKVIFLHLSVIHSVHRGGEGGLARRPPRLDGGTPQWMESPPPGWMEEPPSPVGWRNPPGGWRTPPGWMENPPWVDGGTPPGWMEEPPPPPPAGWRNHPPPSGSRLQHTVYDRPVRILLECILVPWMSIWAMRTSFHFSPNDHRVMGEKSPKIHVRNCCFHVLFQIHWPDQARWTNWSDGVKFGMSERGMCLDGSCRRLWILPTNLDAILGFLCR